MFSDREGESSPIFLIQNQIYENFTIRKITRDRS